MSFRDVAKNSTLLDFEVLRKDFAIIEPFPVNLDGDFCPRGFNPEVSYLIREFSMENQILVLEHTKSDERAAFQLPINQDSGLVRLSDYPMLLKEYLPVRIEQRETLVFYDGIKRVFSGQFFISQFSFQPFLIVGCLYYYRDGSFLQNVFTNSYTEPLMALKCEL